MSRMRSVAVAALCPGLLLFAGLCEAHTFYLKTGKQMQGAIQSETADEVVIDIGYGTVTLRKSDIARIEGDAAGRAVSGVSEKEAREFSLGRGVPEDAADIDYELRELIRLREKARHARAQKRSIEEALHSTRDDMSDLKEKYSEKSAHLRDSTSTFKSISGELAILTREQKSLSQMTQAAHEGIRDDQADILAYLNAYQDLSREAREPDLRESMQAAKGRDKKYYAWFLGQLADMNGDFKQDSVKAEITRDGYLAASVLINGRSTVRLFVLDAGGADLVLSPAVAEGLSLGGGRAPGGTELTLADGRKERARLVPLDSVQVGGTRIVNVSAAVSASVPAGCDGLIGTGFLRRIGIEADRDNQRLLIKSPR